MITIIFHSWMIPTLITFISIFWALFIVKGGSGYFSALSNVLALVPALFVSCLAWMFWGFLK